MLVTVAKTKMINVRINEQTHNDFKVACELKGAGMAQILHQFIVRTIREERDREPEAFKTQSDLIKVEDKGKLSNETLIETRKAS